MKKLIAILCVSIIALSLCACGSSSSSGSSSRSNRQGFTGSDGKYHDYVPEFGNDVNEWMANNW